MDLQAGFLIARSHTWLVWKVQDPTSVVGEGQAGVRGIGWRLAEQIGYNAEAACNRTFKRELGLPPTTWR